MAPTTLDEVTYELFGIVPEEFYAQRFVTGVVSPDQSLSTSFRYGHLLYKAKLQADALRAALPDGGDVLDVGCGSGPYGPTLVGAVPGIKLYGLDMSERCVADARANGYAEAVVCDFLAGLPYPDSRFDAVVSLDLFGHVEFRRKDKLIGEMARVTRPGGGGHHGIETGFVDYLGCDPTDPDDPMRQYVHIDGHIGVEPAMAVQRRFEACYIDVQWHPTYLFPFLARDTLASSDCLKDGFHEVLRLLDSDETRACADLLLGALNRYYIDTLRELLGPAFRPYDEAPDREGEYFDAVDASPDVVAIAKKLCTPTGFSSFAMRKPE